jgi:hypothetical protein
MSPNSSRRPISLMKLSNRDKRYDQITVALEEHLIVFVLIIQIKETARVSCETFDENISSTTKRELLLEIIRRRRRRRRRRREGIHCRHSCCSPESGPIRKCLVNFFLRELYGENGARGVLMWSRSQSRDDGKERKIRWHWN